VASRYGNQPIPVLIISITSGEPFGVTTVQFSDTGQTFTVSHVEELVFDDNHHINL